jgi:hypothetical protein
MQAPPTTRKAPAAHRYLTPDQVAEVVPGLTPDTLQYLRDNGRGPKYRKPTGDLGRLVLYAEADVRAWVEAGTVTTRDQS